MNWQIYTLGGGQYMTLIFNGVAGILGNSDYGWLVKSAFLIGVMVVMVRSAYRGGLVDWPYLIFAPIIYLCVFLPTATVIVTDQVDPSQSSVISNIPIGLAATAGMASGVQYWLAETADAAFSLPDDLQYSQHGLLFGNKLIDSTMHAQFNDPTVASNFSNFFQQCVFYDVLLGKYTMTALNTAPDVWAFIQSNTSVSRAFSYQPSGGGQPTIQICHDAVQPGTGVLNNDLQASIPQIESIYGYNLVPASDRNAAITEYEAALPTAYQYFSNASASAAQILQQATLGNAMKQGISAWAARADAPAVAQQYATALAEQERRSSYTVLGQLAERQLPMMSTLIQAAIYGIFPIAFIIMLLPGGYEAMFTYVKLLAWITLWPFLFALLHLGVTVFSRIATAPALTNFDGTLSLNLSNYTSFGQVMSDYSILAGYLTISIPAIAWAMVSKGAAGVSSIVQGVASSFEKTVQQGSSEGTRGNFQIGNTGFGNASWWQQNTAPSTQVGYDTITGGDAIRRTSAPAAGLEYDSVPQSQLPISQNLESTVRSSIDKGASDATRAARSDSVAEQQRVGSQVAELETLSNRLSLDQGYRDNVSRSATANLEKTAGSLFKDVDTAREQTGLSRQQAVQALLGGSVSLTPSFEGVGAGVKGGYETSGSAAQQRLLQQAKEIGLDKNFGERYASALSAASEVAGSYSGADAKGFSKDISSNLSRDASLASTSTATIERAQSFEEARRLSQGEGFGSKTELDDKFKNYLAARVGGNEAALSLIREGTQGDNPSASAELYRQQRAFADDYTKGIVSNVGSVSSGNVQSGFDADRASITSGGNAAIGGNRAGGAGRVDGGAQAEGLTSSAVDARVSDTRTAAQNEKTTLDQTETREGYQNAGAFNVEKDAQGRETEFAETVPLVFQATKEEGEILTPKPLNITPGFANQIPDDSVQVPSAPKGGSAGPVQGETIRLTQEQEDQIAALKSRK